MELCVIVVSYLWSVYRVIVAQDGRLGAGKKALLERACLSAAHMDEHGRHRSAPWQSRGW